MPRYNRKADFEFGLSQIVPFFDSLGFSLHRGQPYSDRAGTSYSARFVRSPRSVELNHLYSLGPVIYSIGEFSVEHTFYIQALGLAAAAQFPCFADDSISGYSAWLHDLNHVLSPFFVGPVDDFTAIAKRYTEEQRQQQEHGNRDLSYHSTGEHRLKARARELFRQRRYDGVSQIESQIRFPELLTTSERKMFEIARKRQ